MPPTQQSVDLRTRTERKVDDRTYLESLIRHVIDECPERAPTSEQEFQSQQIFQQELAERGAFTRFLPFRFNNNLYAVLALHFAVAVVGSVMFFVQPWVALALHLIAGISYLCEASHWGYILRRLLPFRRSQNLVARLPAEGKPKLRIVLMGHADAAHTGVMFNPLMVSGTSNKPYPQPFGFIRKHMLFAVLGMFILAAIDVLLIATGHGMPLLFWGLTIGLSIGLILNLQVVWRNQIVPGASDNLSGCAALPILAERFADRKPDEVELVFAVTGCEESGVGGSAALMRQMRGRWDKENTVILGLDILTNGKLCYKTVNEVLPMTIPAWLVETLQDVAKDHPTIKELGIYDACAGTDDAVPFVAKGYDGVCIACVDESLGVSRDYHLMTDDADHCDFDQMKETVDYIDDVIEAIIERRLDQANELVPAEKRRIVSRLDEKPTGAFALFLSPWTWLPLGAAAGAYLASILGWEMESVIGSVRLVLSIAMLAFPVFVILDWLGLRPDNFKVGNLFVVGMLSAEIFTALCLLLQPLLLWCYPELAAVSWSTAVIYGSLIGLLLGASLIPLVLHLRQRFNLA